MATNRKLGKTTDIRLAMLKTQLTDLILHEKIETTEARAKEVKAMADSIIALAVKEKDNFEMDYDKLEQAITEKTKVIIPVDIGGVMCDYDRIQKIVEKKANIFKPSSELQKKLGRIAIMADSQWKVPFHKFSYSSHNQKLHSLRLLKCYVF